jgi:DnaJ-class molecular chaperone
MVVERALALKEGKCPVCEGRGEVILPRTYVRCAVCDGSGKRDTRSPDIRWAPCDVCAGVGLVHPADLMHDTVGQA